MHFPCTGILWTPYGWLCSPWFTLSVVEESMDTLRYDSDLKSEKIILPAPTAWPIILASGIALLFAGLVTSLSIGILGAILTVIAFTGWFRDVFPREREEAVDIEAEAITISTP